MPRRLFRILDVALKETTVKKVKKYYLIIDKVPIYEGRQHEYEVLDDRGHIKKLVNHSTLGKKIGTIPMDSASDLLDLAEDLADRFTTARLEKNDKIRDNLLNVAYRARFLYKNKFLKSINYIKY